MKHLTTIKRFTHHLLPIVLILFSLSSTYATMGKGDIMVIGFDGDVTDILGFAVLADIPAGEVIFITDNEWNGSAFTTGEGAAQWTNNTGNSIVAGTIVTLTVTGLSISHGLIQNAGAGGTLSLSTSGDDIYIYQGSAWNNPSNFITAFSSGPDDNATLTGTGLTDGVDAINDTHFTNDDVILYNGSWNCSGVDVQGCSTLFANPGSYAIQDASGDQSIDGTFPDIPANLPASFTPPGVLPIELAWFDANLNDLGQVKIEWETMAEINSSHHIVQHRNEYENSFNDVEIFSGKGTDFSSNHYACLHKDPSPGVNYYRLVHFSTDGQKSITGPVSVFMSQNRIEVYPTIVKSMLNVYLNEEAKSGSTISIYNGTGSLMNRDYLERHRSLHKFDLSAYATGMYMIMIQSGNNKQHFKVFRQ